MNSQIKSFTDNTHTPYSHCDSPAEDEDILLCALSTFKAEVPSKPTPTLTDPETKDREADARLVEVRGAKRAVEQTSQQANKAAAQVRKTKLLLENTKKNLEVEEEILQECTKPHVKASQKLTKLLKNL